MNEIKPTLTLDCSRLLCPMPVIKTQNKLKEMQVGEILEVTCTDPGVLQDIPTWCRINGHEVLNQQHTNLEIIINIKKL